MKGSSSPNFPRIGLLAATLHDALFELASARSSNAHLGIYHHGWLARVGAKSIYITPGSPWENGCCESFNGGKLRNELLNGEIFYTLREARVVIEEWRQHRASAPQGKFITTPRWSMNF